jgi:RND family efflux transporter MFP subunit
MTRGILATGILVATLGCSGKPERTEPAPTGTAIPVSVITVGPPGGFDVYRAAGTVRAVRRAELATRMMARIETILVRTGDPVRKGQVLATLERGAMTAAGNQATAGLTLATSNLRRMERLYADSAIPIAQLEGARAAFEQARGQSDAAVAELGYASLVAPFDGVITARNADPGALAAPGQPVLVVEAGGAREIVIGVPEPVAAAIAAGQPVTALIGAEERPAPAKVAVVVPSANPLSRTVEVRLTTTAPLTPGLTAVVELPLADRPTREVVLPATAVIERGELTGVFLVTADSTARLRWIRLGRTIGADVVVASGLMAGDLVVAEPSRVKDGSRVSPVTLKESGR